MITFILLLVLIFGFFMGLKRGLILQLIHLFGFIISFIIAKIYYSKLASHLSLWIPYPDLKSEEGWAVFLNNMPLENGFYNAIAFTAIFLATIIVLKIIAAMLDVVANLPVLKVVNKTLGAVLGFVEVYFIAFVLLNIAALVPVQIVQDKLMSSNLAINMIENTPLLSKLIQSIWFTDILSQIG